MTIPHHLGVLLPIEQRYTNIQFRRFARRFRSRRLDYDDAQELAAFLAVCPRKSCARWIFRWDKYSQTAAKAVEKHYRDAARESIEANISSFGITDAVGLLRAMRDSGWKSGPWPPFIKRAVLQLAHERGVRAAADGFGLGVDQVYVMSRPRKRANRKAVRAAVGLAVS